MGNQDVSSDSCIRPIKRQSLDILMSPRAELCAKSSAFRFAWKMRSWRRLRQTLCKPGFLRELQKVLAWAGEEGRPVPFVAN